MGCSFSTTQLTRKFPSLICTTKHRLKYSLIRPSDECTPSMSSSYEPSASLSIMSTISASSISTENPRSTTSTASHSTNFSRSDLAIVVGIVVGLALLVLATFSAFIFSRRRQTPIQSAERQIASSSAAQEDIRIDSPTPSTFSSQLCMRWISSHALTPQARHAPAITSSDELPQFLQASTALSGQLGEGRHFEILSHRSVTAPASQTQTLRSLQEHAVAIRLRIAELQNYAEHLEAELYSPRTNRTTRQDESPPEH